MVATQSIARHDILLTAVDDAGIHWLATVVCRQTLKIFTMPAQYRVIPLLLHASGVRSLVLVSLSRTPLLTKGFSMPPIVLLGVHAEPLLAGSIGD